MALAEAPPQEPPTGLPDPKGLETSVYRPVKAHAPKVNTSLPTPDEERIVAGVLEMFSRARNHRRPLINTWRENYRMLRNRYWRTSQRPGWMPSPMVPEIFPIVASIVAWMTDQRFMHTISPASLPHTVFNQMFQAMSAGTCI
jgi:hypothetical protein